MPKKSAYFSICSLINPLGWRESLVLGRGGKAGYSWLHRLSMRDRALSTSRE